MKENHSAYVNRSLLPRPSAMVASTSAGSSSKRTRKTKSTCKITPRSAPSAAQVAAGKRRSTVLEVTDKSRSRAKHAFADRPKRVHSPSPPPPDPIELFNAPDTDTTPDSYVHHINAPAAQPKRAKRPVKTIGVRFSRHPPRALINNGGVAPDSGMDTLPGRLPGRADAS